MHIGLHKRPGQHAEGCIGPTGWGRSAEIGVGMAPTPNQESDYKVGQETWVKPDTYYGTPQ